RPNCILFVDSIGKSDSELKEDLYFSAVSLSSNRILIRAPAQDKKILGHHKQCEETATRLVQFPEMQGDLTAIQSHGKFFYDLKREDEDASFTTGNGTPVNNSLIELKGDRRDDFAPQFIASDYGWLFRMAVDWDLEQSIVLCQSELN
ncbi:hypothetical protein FHG87_025697, partial [Trinorchestia longiramus]